MPLIGLSLHLHSRHNQLNLATLIPTLDQQYRLYILHPKEREKSQKVKKLFADPGEAELSASNILGSNGSTRKMLNSLSL